MMTIEYWHPGADNKDKDHIEDVHDLRLADIETFPTRTRVGNVWCRPIPPPNSQQVIAKRKRRTRGGRWASLPLTNCDFCAMQGQCCKRGPLGDFMACEQVLVRELLP